MGVPVNTWRYSLPIMRRLVSSVELVRESVPFGDVPVVWVGTRYWERVGDDRLRRRDRRVRASAESLARGVTIATGRGARRRTCVTLLGPLRPLPPVKSPPKGSLVAQLRESLRHTRQTLALVWRSSPPQTIALGVLTLVGGLVPLGVAYAGKRIVDAVVATIERRDAAVGAGRARRSSCAMALVQRGLGLVRSVLGARLGVDINVTILEKALGLDLRFFEDPDFYDKLTRARREASSRPIAAHHRELRARAERHHPGRLRRAPLRFSGWAVLALCVGDGAGHDRRDALLEARVQAAQLALARVAAARCTSSTCSRTTSTPRR